jgi:glycosyltransferase involved in cell wall biosynthesis
MREGKAYSYDAYAVSALAQAVRRAHDFDVVHSHVGPLGIPFGALSASPLLHTVHEGLDSVDALWLLELHGDARVVAISDSQVATVAPSRRHRIPTIHHGLDLSPYEASEEHSGYLLFLGRMGWRKNPAGAIRVAREAGYSIVLAGSPQDKDERVYFDECVRPELRWQGVDYAGTVSQEEKIALMRGAIALVFPIAWEEHFGLVMIEAMACGTPVVALDRGSVPEVVEHGVTGFIGTSEEELVDALARIGDLDRAVIANRARERFDISRMTLDYVDIYRRSIEAGK